MNGGDGFAAVNQDVHQMAPALAPSQGNARYPDPRIGGIRRERREYVAVSAPFPLRKILF